MTNPTRRFRKNNKTHYPDYTKLQLSDIAHRVVRKNKNNETDVPLTIASLYGLVDQRTYFSKTIASADISGYYLLKKGEFAYNKSYSNGFDYGAIKRLDNHEQGALSTLYICFALDDKVDSDYMTHYFDSQKWKKEVYYRCAEGARNHGLLNISASDFFEIELNLPVSIEEQQKIAALFTEVDKLISATSDELSALKNAKRGLIQKIFSREIRFKKDDGTEYLDWTSIVFNDAFTAIGNNTLSRAELSDKGTVRNVHYGDILTVLGSIVDPEKDNLPFVADDEKVQKYQRHLLRDGDVIFADTAEDESVGKAIEIMNCNTPVISGLHTTPCRPAEGLFEPGYLGYYLNSPAYHNQLRPLMQGVKVTSVSRTAMSETKLDYPADFEEQRKIADLFSSMDDAISAANDELQGYKDLKKYLLQNMFA